ncbi:MAG: ABC transporter permease [Alphaproteobacteria bacterium]|nr:ABC transporter permease [Alphaproteobacteria bacterium]
MRFLSALGALVIAFAQATGRLGIFAGTSLSHIVRPPFFAANLAQQMASIGYFSLPVVGLTALFTGMALALQIFEGSSRFNAEGTVAYVVAIGMTRELAPVLGGLMVAGRVGAAMAAEIGTMRVTEQIDALVTLSTNPFKYLMVPRLVAGMTMVPFLVLVGDIIGIFGGFTISVNLLDFNAATYIRNTFDILEKIDIIAGLVKAAVFGLIVTLMGCFHGYYSRGGAQGVGRATTNAVVSASILILTANLVVTQIFFMSRG